MINPLSNYIVGGPVAPPQQVAANTVSNQLAPSTGGNSQAIPLNIPTMSGNTPPVPVMGPTTGGALPPTSIPGLQLPGVTLNTSGLALDSINGNNFVVAGASAPSTAGVGTTINNIANQFGSGLSGASGLDTATRLAAATAYTPTGGPLDAILAINNQTMLPERRDATTLALDSIGQITNSENAYLKSAYRRGLETSGRRGLLNSSIAGGAAQREAIDASMPIFNQAMGLISQREQQEFAANQATRAAGYDVASMREQQLFQQARDTFNMAGQLEGQDRQNAFARAQTMLQEGMRLQNMREQQAFQAQESATDRAQSVNNRMLDARLDSDSMRLGSYLQGQQINQQAGIQAQMQAREFQMQAQMQERDAYLRQKLTEDTTLQQDWLADRNFTRQFNANLSMLPISSSMDMYGALAKYALEEPEVYTPEVISGFANFFRNDMAAMLNQYLGGNG